MSISSLLDGGGKEIHYRSGFGKGHHEKGGLDTEVSFYGLEPVEELCRQMTRPQEFEVGDYVFLKVMPKRGAVRFGK